MTQGTQTEREARDIGLAIGLGAALFALVQVLAAASATRQNADAVRTLERSLVDLSNGGGTVVTAPFARLAPVWITSYVLALVALAGGLILCWLAGRLAAQATGQRAAGALAGRWVMTCASAVWIVAALLAFVAFQLDGTFSWVVGILATILLAPASPPRGTLYTVSPTPTYLIIQIAVLLIHAIFGVLLAIALGTQAGRMGARRAMPAA
ncbi:MAG TPA: hypothetical protein VKQ30_06070 [Ktedonobacterales bacterium]|nr:hypothetical protein [Ktedonobacterales bacterium]